MHWVDRADETSLAAAIEDRDWSDWYAWAGIEASSLKVLRKRLKEAFGFPKADVHAQAYWNSGRAMGSRRGDGEADQVTAASPAAAKEPEVSTLAQPTTAPKGKWRSQGAKGAPARFGQAPNGSPAASSKR